MIWNLMWACDYDVSRNDMKNSNSDEVQCYNMFRELINLTKLHVAGSTEL